MTMMFKELSYLIVTPCLGYFKQVGIFIIVMSIQPLTLMAMGSGCDNMDTTHDIVSPMTCDQCHKEFKSEGKFIKLTCCCERYFHAVCIAKLHKKHGMLCCETCACEFAHIPDAMPVDSDLHARLRDALRKAILAGEHKTIKHLIALGTDHVNVISQERLTDLLSDAIIADDQELVTCLIFLGADLKAETYFKSNHLRDALLFGRIKIALQLANSLKSNISRQVLQAIAACNFKRACENAPAYALYYEKMCPDVTQKEVKSDSKAPVSALPQ